MTKSFAHLHNHSSYSLLDGAAKMDEMVQAAADDGQPAVAVTDHGNLYGLIPLHKACKKAGIKPIFGSELYFYPDRFERPSRAKNTTDMLEDSKTEKSFYHMTMLAETTEGYHNLLKLSSEAYLSGLYYKPRVDWSLLEEHSAGLIATTGCLGGIVLQHLMKDDYDGAVKSAARLQDIFGRDNLFIELQDHGIPEQIRTNPELLRLAKQIDAPLLAANDLHYTHAGDHVSHDALLCQPPGTIVDVITIPSRAGLPRGAKLPLIYSKKRIEDVQIGDRVLSWKHNIRRGNIVKQGSAVTKTGNRFYAGNLIKVTTASGATSSYTDNHICVVRLDNDLTEGNYVTYLMRQGNSFRIGYTKYRKPRQKNRPESAQLGLLVRAKEQNADAVWALSVHQTSHEAREQEAYISWKYNIPTWSFSDVKKSGPRTPYYESLWNRVGDLTSNAEKCLTDHGRIMEYPFWSVKETKPGQQKPFFLRACNLLSGMQVCEVAQISEIADGRTYNGSGAWQGVQVSTQWYEGQVYSLDVEKHHTYVADGIVTHNCVQTGSTINTPDRFKFSSDQHYLKSAYEMRSLFREVEIACDNTLWVAERCNVDLDFDTLHLPHFPIPEGYESELKYLKKLTLDGLNKKYGGLNDEIIARVKHELAIIEQVGMISYFLIVHDIIAYAKSQGIRTGPGRGSCAGSIIMYALDVTQVDPLKYGLIFERFLNPSRVSMADADLDFDTRYREQMIRYVTEKYGQERVAQIITFSKIKARAAVRDAARVLGYGYEAGDTLAKAMPKLIMGRDTPLHECFDESTEGYTRANDLRSLVESNEDYQKIVDVALGLENLHRSDGIHAAAVVIADQTLTNLIPVQKKTNGPVVTQYEMGAVEELGLLKMDFLGLANLDVITDTVKMVGGGFDIMDIPMDDEKTFELLQRGDTIGIFQLESAPLRALLRKLQPTAFDDIAAVVALYRPGPMGANMHNDYADRKNGRQDIKYFHEDAKEILSETYGLMIYQEQIMDISKQFAGYNMAQADNLRKIVGKKIRSAMEAEKERFISGCINTGYTQTLADYLFNIIEKFADYSFNKSHSYCYGLISYQTAYLKAHYPKEYMAALCNTASDIDRIGVFLNDMRNMGIEVLPPDVNYSQVGFSVEGNGVRVGMEGLKGSGRKICTTIVENRTTPYTSAYDFCSRNPITKGALESLIYVGAFDQFGETRLGLISAIEDLLQATRNEAKAAAVGQTSLFGSMPIALPAIVDKEYDDDALLKFEKAYSGNYFSGHPLQSYIPSSITFGDFESLEVGNAFKSTYMVNDINKFITKKGDTMGKLTGEDIEGSFEIIVFPMAWKKFGHLLEKDGIYQIDVKVGLDSRSDDHNFICEKVTRLS